MTPTALDLDADRAVGSPSITVDSPVLPDAPADSPLSAAHPDAPSPSRSGTLRGMPTSSRTTSARSATARTRSRSPAPATTQSLSALSSPAAASPLGPPHVPISPSAHAATNPQAALSRPSPVVPSSPSVPPTPSFSRPTSPRPSASARGLAGDEPVSPTRTRNSTLGAGADAALSSPSGAAGQDGGMLSASGSQVDLSHIFERDVEFAPSHHISPSEAVDVAVPPVLTEAAVALSVAADGDPITSRDLAALALDAEYDAVAGSGWSSPVVAPSAVAHGQPPPLAHQSQSQDKQQHPLSHVYANASRSPTRGASRSFSPDSGSGGRAASPESSTFSVGTPPTSAGGGSPPPPGALGGPFSQRLAEALENEASKPGLGAPFLGAQRATSPESVVGGSAAAASSASSSPPVPHVAPQSPQQARSTSHSSASFTSALRPSHLMPFPAGSHAGSDDPFSSSSPLHSPSHELGANPVAAPHPRKLSFASYADLVNEERLAELTGERLADVPSGGAAGAGGAATPGGSGLPGTASPMGGRSRSGTKTGPHALGLLHVEQLEGKLAAATLEA
ncbi:hypothetical protein JCM9279_001490 [Rhodotorula babjevae]